MPTPAKSKCRPNSWRTTPAHKTRDGSRSHRNGKNRAFVLHKRAAVKEDTLVIHEIYASVQGESTFAGLPCTFVRTTGCNLRCAWCDTPQAFYGGTRVFPG